MTRNPESSADPPSKVRATCPELSQLFTTVVPAFCLAVGAASTVASSGTSEMR